MNDDTFSKTEILCKKVIMPYAIQKNTVCSVAFLLQKRTKQFFRLHLTQIIIFMNFNNFMLVKFEKLY